MAYAETVSERSRRESDSASKREYEVGRERKRMKAGEIESSESETERTRKSAREESTVSERDVRTLDVAGAVLEESASSVVVHHDRKLRMHSCHWCRRRHRRARVRARGGACVWTEGVCL